MAAPKGNRFWEVRSSHGANPKFATPEDLWNACEEYFHWTEDNPLMAAETVKHAGEGKIMDVPKMRAMTLQGLCLFIDISMKQWRNWRTEREDLLPVLTRAESIIYQQKFAGAAADLLNANIIARDLGLADKTALVGGGEDDSPIQVDDRSLARAAAFLLTKEAHEGDNQPE